MKKKMLKREKVFTERIAIYLLDSLLINVDILVDLPEDLPEYDSGVSGNRRLRNKKGFVYCM